MAAEARHPMHRIFPSGHGRIQHLMAPIICAILLLMSASQAIAALSFPDRERRAVVDAAAVIPDDKEAALETRILAWNSATGHQLVVATVPGLSGRPIGDYGYRLLRHWRLGSEEADNGVILLLAPNEREVRIEVGYGLEPVLTDAISGRIIAETVRPALRQGDIAGALDGGANRIMSTLTPPDTAPQQLSAPPPEPVYSWGAKLGGVLFLLFVIAVIGFLLWRGARLLAAIGRGIWRGLAGTVRFFAGLLRRYWIFLWPLPLLFPDRAERTRARRDAELERRKAAETERLEKAAADAARKETELKAWQAREKERTRAERAERAALRERYGKNYERHSRWCPFEKRILEPTETAKLAERDRKLAAIATANRQAIEEAERLRTMRYSSGTSSNWFDRYDTDSGDAGSWDASDDSGFDGGGGSGGGGGADDRY